MQVSLLKVDSFWLVHMVRKDRTALPGEGQSSTEEAKVESGAGEQQPQGQQQLQLMSGPQGGNQAVGRGACQGGDERRIGGPLRPQGQQQSHGIQSGGRGGYQGGNQSGGRGGYIGGRGGPPHGGMVPQLRPQPPQQQIGIALRQYQYPCGPKPLPGPYGGPSKQPLHRASLPQYHSAPSSSTMPVGSPTEPLVGEISSQAPQLISTNVTQQFSDLSLDKQSSPSQSLVPASSKCSRFPLRPGKGTEGTECTVKANHFFAQLPVDDLYQYDVTVTPEDTPRGVNRAVMKTLVNLYKKSQLGNRLTDSQNNLANEKYAKEFGITINPMLAKCDARVLSPPRLKYHESGRERDCLPQVGQWNMMNKKMVNGGTVNNWICVYFALDVSHDAVCKFCQELAQMCKTSGMNFNSRPVMPPVRAPPRDQVETADVLKVIWGDLKKRLAVKKLDLLIFLLPNNSGSLYGDLKRICETDLGVVSQCCLVKHVVSMKNQYLANVSLKINVKVGGRNTVLVDALSRCIPQVTDRVTIIFGADVTHPHPGEDSSPSIAAVVASQDWPEVTNYAASVSAQAHRQEIIQDLFKSYIDPLGCTITGGMIMDLLKSFIHATGRKPERIIFYRDGVSEGQFHQVLLHELDAIRKACASLELGYQPPVTFVVVQKRHRTRLFVDNHRNRNSADRSGNILPGTVVDSKICHPTEFDFYLCSHAGIQGTSRPAHYHVLWDENKFTADDLQTLTYKLCYTYARCTRSVSTVPPVLYAHLAASRARCYMEPKTSDSGSDQGGGADANVRLLPALKENVKKVMFYC